MFFLRGWVVLLLYIISTVPANAATLRVACGAKNTTWEYCVAASERWAAATRSRVDVIATPPDSLAMLGYYQQQLAARSPDIDIYLIDNLSLPTLYSHFISLSSLIKPDTLAAFDKDLLAAYTQHGRLLALPWYRDMSLLYYRQDLLIAHNKPVPTTWKELLETGGFIANRQRNESKKLLYPYTFQGRVSEALTCNTLEWIYSHSPPTDAKSMPTLASLPAATISAALSTASDLFTTGSPSASLTYAEEESRQRFQTGHAVFMRNWTYAWALLNADDSPVQGKVGISALPAGVDGQAVSTLGGWAFAISRYSTQQEAALSLIRHLTSAEEQKQRALLLGLQPTLPALFHDEEIISAQPHLGFIRDMDVTLLDRPALANGMPYQRFSDAVRNTAYDVLSQQQDTTTATQTLLHSLRQHRRPHARQ